MVYRLGEYLASHAEGSATLRAALSDGDRLSLEMAEAVALDFVEQFKLRVRHFTTHWRLRNWVFNSVHQSLVDRTPGVTYFWSDWQVYVGKMGAIPWVL